MNVGLHLPPNPRKGLQFLHLMHFVDKHGVFANNDNPNGYLFGNINQPLVFLRFFLWSCHGWLLAV